MTAKTYVAYHDFETLSEADSGKQHKFTWMCRDTARAQPKFVCHMMYQSGNDEIPLTSGLTAPRGRVLRIAFSDKGSTEPGRNGMALQIYDPEWTEKNYIKLAQSIEWHDALKTEQKAAIFSQLASLYTLMATQYGEVWKDEASLPLYKPRIAGDNQWQPQIHELITDASLLAASQWFAERAKEYLADSVPNLKAPLALPEKLEKDADPYMTWAHDITAKAGKKIHSFTFANQHKDLMLTAEYTSGEAGGDIVIHYPPKEGNAEGITQTFHTRHSGNLEELFSKGETELVMPGSIIHADSHTATLMEMVKNESISKEQCIATLTMLASLYRLVGTHYHEIYGQLPDGRMHPTLQDSMPEHLKPVEADIAGDMFFIDGRVMERPKTVDAESLDAFVMDPPYHFMADLLADSAAQIAMDNTPKLRENPHRPMSAFRVLE